MYKDYIDLNYMLNKLQWENYIDNKKHNLNNVCEKIFEYIDSMLKNKEIILSKRYIREWIDKSCEVSTLKNKLDDFDNYINEVRIIKEDLADKICPDVISLMKLRNTKSIEIGYKNYQDAILKSDNMTYEELKNWLDDFINKNMQNAIQIINKYNVKWNSWFSDLDKINDENIKYIDSYELIFKFAEKMDMLEVIENVKIYYGNSICFATKIAPDDIRISVGDIKSLNDIRTLFHEFGHAILYYYSNDSYFQITQCLDEVFAVIIENLAPTIVLSEDEVSKINEINCLEYARTAVSGLFELELWNNIDLAEKLYSKYYSRFNIEIENPKLWCLDSFRSIDCMYIYNYTLGQIASEHFKDIFYNNYKGKCKPYSNVLKKICSKISEINYVDLLNFEK